jgi:hypothetical protein
VLFVPWLTLQLIDVFLVPFLSALDILERIVVTNRLNGFSDVIQPEGHAKGRKPSGKFIILVRFTLPVVK